jgi:hypothetical protein
MQIMLAVQIRKPLSPTLFHSANRTLVTSGIRTAPNVRRASACGTATVVSLWLRSCRLSACAPLPRSPNHKPKQKGGRRCATGLCHGNLLDSAGHIANQ